MRTGALRRPYRSFGTPQTLPQMKQRGRRPHLLQNSPAFTCGDALCVKGSLHTLRDVAHIPRTSSIPVRQFPNRTSVVGVTTRPYRTSERKIYIILLLRVFGYVSYAEITRDMSYGTVSHRHVGSYRRTNTQIGTDIVLVLVHTWPWYYEYCNIRVLAYSYGDVPHHPGTYPYRACRDRQSCMLGVEQRPLELAKEIHSNWCA